MAKVPDTAKVARSYIDEDRACTSILQTLASKLHPFEVVAACWQNATAKLSLGCWIQEYDVIRLAGERLFHSSVVLINPPIITCLAHPTFRQQADADD